MRSAMVRLLAALALCLQLAPRVPAEPELENEAETSGVAAYRPFRVPMSLDDQLFQFTEKRNSAAKYCGKKLSDALHLICKGHYNIPEPIFDKKSTFDAQDSLYWMLPSSPLDEESKFPFRPRSLATALMPNVLRRRMIRGVADECCAKSCTIKEMRSYCRRH